MDSPPKKRRTIPSSSAKLGAAAKDKAAALLEKAKTLEGEYAVIGHYLRVYALELLITAKQAGQSKPEADQMMLPG